MVDYWLWIAYEPKINSCLLIQLFRERTIFGCYQFSLVLEMDMETSLLFILIVLFWYNDACKWLRLKHIVYGIELKNIMERFIRRIKDGTECFDDHIHV